MDVRKFGGRLGASDRAVSKWEAGGEAYVPRIDAQAMLEKVTAHARTRFALIIDIGPDAAERQAPAADLAVNDREPEKSPTSDNGYRSRSRILLTARA
jgi:hypothetical protein